MTIQKQFVSLDEGKRYLKDRWKPFSDFDEAPPPQISSAESFFALDTSAQ
jgi:hypothetical protein